MSVLVSSIAFGTTLHHITLYKSTSVDVKATDNNDYIYSSKAPNLLQLSYKCRYKQRLRK